MAVPPFNIFTHHRDPDGALALLKTLLPEAQVTYHADGQWATITGTWPQPGALPPLSMKVTHNPSLYAGPGWMDQLLGMKEYFKGILNADRRPEVYRYLPGITFVLSFMHEPDPDGAMKDPRDAVVFQMAQWMKGVVFLPDCLLDIEGKVLLSADGNVDTEAQLPEHTPAEFLLQVPIRAATSDEGDPDDHPPLNPPSGERVATRLRLMTALVWRGFAESETRDDIENERHQIVQRLQRTGVWPEAEEWEAAALDCPVGELESDITWRLTWLCEGASVLAWALRLANLPPYDTEVPVDELYEMALQPDAPLIEPVLRSSEEFHRLESQLLPIHWRLIEYSLRPGRKDLAAFVLNAAWAHMDLGLARLTDNDLEVRGSPIDQCPENDWRMAAGIVTERRKALHWLMGDDPIYSNNRSDT